MAKKSSMPPANNHSILNFFRPLGSSSSPGPTASTSTPSSPRKRSSPSKSRSPGGLTKEDAANMRPLASFFDAPKDGEGQRSGREEREGAPFSPKKEEEATPMPAEKEKTPRKKKEAAGDGDLSDEFTPSQDGSGGSTPKAKELRRSPRKPKPILRNLDSMTDETADEGEELESIPDSTSPPPSLAHSPSPSKGKATEEEYETEEDESQEVATVLLAKKSSLSPKKKYKKGGAKGKGKVTFENDEEKEDTVMEDITEGAEEEEEVPVPNVAFYSPSRTVTATPSPSPSKSLSLSRLVPSSSIFYPNLATPQLHPESSTSNSSRYIRDPSGSPLSSLGDTPSPYKAERKKKDEEPRFWVEIEVSKGKRKAVEFVKRSKKTKDAAMKLDVEGSPTPTKKKVDKGKGRAIEASLGLQELSDSDSDSSDSDDLPTPSNSNTTPTRATVSSPNSDSNSDDSDDELEALMSRAAARRKDGTAHLTVPSTSTTPSEVEPQPEVRRSLRAPVAKEALKPKVAKLVVGSSGGGGGKLGLQALMKERKGKEGEGKGESWEAAKRLLGDLDDKLLLSDDEDDILTRETTPLNNLTSDHIDKMVHVAAGAHPTPFDDGTYITSPEKRAAEKKALLLGSLLKKDVEKSGKGGREGEEEEKRKRAVWKDDQDVVVQVGELRFGLEVKEGEENSWKGCVVKAFNDGLKDPKLCPSPFQLFSPTSPQGLGSPEDHIEVSSALLSLISHPHVDPHLADRAIQLLHRISLPLPAKMLFKCFELVGVKNELLKLPVEVEKEKMEGLQTVEIVYEKRMQTVERILRVLQDMGANKLIRGSDAVAFAIFLIRLSLDPVSAPLRNELKKTLQTFVELIVADTVSKRAELVDEVLAVYIEAKPNIQLDVVRSFPSRTRSSRVLRRWLAYAFLDDKFERPSNQSVYASPPPATYYIKILRNLNGYFAFKNDMDDIAFCDRTKILALAFTDITDDMDAGGDSVKEDIGEIINALKWVDGRIRTDVRNGNPERNRAKNSITSFQYSLTYQHRTATGWKGAEDDEEMVVTEGKNKRRKIMPGKGQTTLSFAPVT